MDFISKLTDLVDSLRFVDRPLRTEALCKFLMKLNENSSSLGWDPTACAGEPFYRIKNINIEDCRVFRTKARAPSLIVCEVVREDLDVNLNNDDDNEVNVDSKKDSRSNSPSKTPSKHRSHSSSFNEIENISNLVDSSIHQVIADIHKTQAEIVARNSSKDQYDDEGAAVISTDNDNDSLQIKEKSDSQSNNSHNRNDNGNGNGDSETDFTIRRALRRPSSTPSLLPANRKLSSLQSIVGSASTEDLQLLSISDMASMRSNVENDVNNIGIDKVRDSDMDAVIKQKVFESAQRLLESGKIDQSEFEELLKSDTRFRDESAKEVLLLSSSSLSSLSLPLIG